jgi:hypothetical protein
MPTQQDVDDLLVQIRKFFGEGDKSGNKRYSPDRSGRLPDSPSQKQIDRAAQASASVSSIIFWRDERKKSGLSDYQYGETIWKTGTKAGNCWEQACVAAWGAQFYGFTTSYTCMIDDPGDHVFCLVDYKNPVWKTVSDMKTAGGEGWIIDPWANTCCRPGEYVERFQAKMQKWAAQGKRIWYDTKVNNFTGWTDALAYKYRDGFLNGPIAYSQCMG